MCGEGLSLGGSTKKKDRIASWCVCCGSEQLQSSAAILMPFIAHRVFGWEPVLIDESWGLNSINQGHAYSICKSMLCKECGFLFLDLRFSDSEIARLYADYRGASYASLREKYEPGYIARNNSLNDGIGYIDKIESFLDPYLEQPLTVLDWGGDTGKNTPFKGRAERVDIYDISDKLAIEGVNAVSLAEAKDRDYKLLVCSNVLEHVPYPSELLEDIKEVMGSNSVLYIEVPFERVMQNPDAHLPMDKKHWHEHINFFSETSLRKLLDNVGLHVLEIGVLEAVAGGQGCSLFQIACRKHKQVPLD